MSRLDDLRHVKEKCSARAPTACGCVHELVSSAKNIIQFCPIAQRNANPLCYHRDDRRDIVHIVGEAARLDIISPQEERSYLRLAEEIILDVERIDERAQNMSEELADAGELVGIADFSDHWFAEEVRGWQRSHAGELQEVLRVIHGRADAAMNVPEGAGMAAAAGA